MTESGKDIDRRGWAVGGTTLIGLGVGLMFVQRSVFVFIACLFIGIGAGLLIAAWLPDRRDRG